MTTNGEATKAIEAYLRQSQEIGKKILAAQEERRKVITSITGLDLPRLVSEQIEKIGKTLKEITSPAFEERQRRLKELPPRTQEALILLGKHGWYFDLQMPMSSLWKLKNALEEGIVHEAEDALAQYFEERLDKIEALIVGRFTTREKVIRAAFSAHRRCEYELSIPVFLSQTDGICKEVVKEHFFIKQNKKPRTAIYVEQIAADTFRAALLSPLAHSLPIGASESERDAGFSELNRHMVLHGESVDYGTKTNSLKAISLINYVANVLRRDDNRP